MNILLMMVGTVGLLGVTSLVLLWVGMAISVMYYSLVFLFSLFSVLFSSINTHEKRLNE